MNPYFKIIHPHLFFWGNDVSYQTGKIIERYGKNVLLIMGNHIAKNFEKYPVYTSLKNNDIHFEIVFESGEPTVEKVDKISDAYAKYSFNCIIAVGGGSIIDLGKAVSAMIGTNETIENYLEGLPNYREHNGNKLPFIAIPTTAGTGSEATKNAVISKIGEHGYKRSLRHDNFVPDIAIIDPTLHLSCPPIVTAASGLDSLTQLIESYLSPNANILTDFYAEKGIELIVKSLLTAYNEPENLEARTHMAIAAFFSGISLANAGLGAVHGFASSIGGFYNIPHGIICGTLLGATLQKNVEIILNTTGHNLIIWDKLNKIAQLFSEKEVQTYDIFSAIQTINEWIDFLKIPKLRTYGITENDVEKIVNATQIKSNITQLNTQDLTNILLSRI